MNDIEPNVMITTKDNPYDPFTQFDQWNSYDTQMGYNTLAYLGRVDTGSYELSESEGKRATQAAIDEIIDYDILGIYDLVVEKK